MRPGGSARPSPARSPTRAGRSGCPCTWSRSSTGSCAPSGSSAPITAASRRSAEIARELEMSIEEVDQIRRTSQTPVSLEKPVGDDDESEFGHFLEDESEPLPDEVANLSMRNEALTRALSMLGERERKVLELRFGLNGESPSHARRGRADVQRHARADPPDREPLAEEAPRLRRRREASRRRVDSSRLRAPLPPRTRRRRRASVTLGPRPQAPTR